MNKCKCDNCDKSTSRDFFPGHDQRLRANLEQKVGGLLSLKELVIACIEYATGKTSDSEILRTIRQLFTRKTDK
ncbi:MAG: hypothetical protein Q7J98_11325 [Kiritimatiellia bacterium]|nr:hypothetical protein [Kiritimatiellia bacterium]